MGLKYIISDPEIRGGMPIMRGTRFTVSQLLRELADGISVDVFAEEYDYDVMLVKNVLGELASRVRNMAVEEKTECSCDLNRVLEFQREIESLEEKERAQRKIADDKFQPIKDDYDKRIATAQKNCRDIEDLRKASMLRKLKRSALQRFLKEENLEYPPIGGYFYPKGSRYCDSFGFRSQMPGECDGCYEEYRSGYSEAMKGNFD
jgi:uncharacterized protein (DUF433 family)